MTTTIQAIEQITGEDYSSPCLETIAPFVDEEWESEQEVEYAMMTLEDGHTFFGIVNANVDAEYQRSLKQMIATYRSDLVGLISWCRQLGLDATKYNSIDDTMQLLFEHLVMNA